MNQGQSFRTELIGGYLWAPQTTKGGYPVQHHTDMWKARVGDVVISYSSTAIRALIQIAQPPEDASRPEDLPDEPWLSEGIRAEGDYWVLDNPIRLREIPEEARIPENGPFSSEGSVKQSYLFSTSSDLAEQLRTRFAYRWPPGSPWADYDILAEDATHLIFKWSADQEPRTFDLHRGDAKIMANDLVSTPDSGLTVQVCGDAHLLNFGVFGTPERALLFDLNDFDETLPGPWEWDVKRFAASFLIASRDDGFDDEETRAGRGLTQLVTHSGGRSPTQSRCMKTLSRSPDRSGGDDPCPDGEAVTELPSERGAP